MTSQAPHGCDQHDHKLHGSGRADSEGDINLGEGRARWWAGQSEDVQAGLAEDSRYFLHQALSTPCLDLLEHAQGSWLTSISGARYLDFHGNSVHQLGHGHPRVVAAVQQQLADLPFAPRRYTHQVAIDCARTLAELAPGDLNRVLFAPGGSEVVGIALKLARFITGNSKVVSLWDAFHGASLDAISVGGEACFRAGMGPLMAGVERIPPPTRYRGVWYRGEGDDLHYADYLEYVIEKEGGIGAFIAEPIRNTDVQVPSKAYWQRVREICDRHKVLLIVDEIPNALGRTGHWFSFEEFGIEPDIICLGKGCGGRGGAVCCAHHPRPFQSGGGHFARSLHPREESHWLRGGSRHYRDNPRSGIAGKSAGGWPLYGVRARQVGRTSPADRPGARYRFALGARSGGRSSESHPQ